MKIVFSGIGAFVAVMLMLAGQTNLVVDTAAIAAQLAAGLGCTGLVLMALVNWMTPQQVAA